MSLFVSAASSFSRSVFVSSPVLRASRRSDATRRNASISSMVAPYFFLRRSILSSLDISSSTLLSSKEAALSRKSVTLSFIPASAADIVSRAVRSDAKGAPSSADLVNSRDKRAIDDDMEPSSESMIPFIVAAASLRRPAFFICGSISAMRSSSPAARFAESISFI